MREALRGRSLSGSLFHLAWLHPKSILIGGAELAPVVASPAVVAHVARVSLLPSFRLRLLSHNLLYVPIILLFKHTCVGIQAEFG